jgi:hypothetical protein
LGITVRASVGTHHYPPECRWPCVLCGAPTPSKNFVMVVAPLDASWDNEKRRAGSPRG